MNHAERCPVCDGSGKVDSGEPSGVGINDRQKTCHGCGGLGWITVQGEYNGVSSD